MRQRINVGEALKSLEGTFLARDVPIQVPEFKRGVETGRHITVHVSGVDFLGLALIETRTLVRLFKVFKQTRVKSVTVEAVPDGVHILFDRAFYFLKGIKDERRQ